jgi:class 3 adenylate cyclase
MPSVAQRRYSGDDRPRGGGAGGAADQVPIGVNIGDVIVDEHDIFGDGVNVAARLEALSEPGGICVTWVVRHLIRDMRDYTFDGFGRAEDQKHCSAGAHLPD